VNTGTTGLLEKSKLAQHTDEEVGMMLGFFYN
jgi:hypothetical protein